MIIRKGVSRGANFFRRHAEEFPLFSYAREHAHNKKLDAYRDVLPSIEPGDSEILVNMCDYGIFMTSLDALKMPLTSDFLRGADDLLKRLDLITFSEGCKQFQVQPSPAQILGCPATFLWGANERILKIAENYLGLPAAYHGMYLRRDLVTSLQIKSRLWHRDMEDYKSFKVVVYLRDVPDESYGPLQYISKPLSQMAAEKLDYRFGYLKDHAMKKAIPEKNWRSCLGPRGTVMFMDTAQLFHRGCVPTKAERKAVFFDYTSRKPKRAYYCKSSLPASMLTELAEGLTDYQVKSLLWRQHPI